ncbi:MAG: MaoC family dehydratase [Acidimicrobiia bacterium]|nr:MaoC family dehydratase [Acidimicrobiia bacterium]
MADWSEYIGRPTGRGTVVVERSALENFARSLHDENPLYHDADAAEAAGFAGVPAPPTYAFAAQNWGKWQELQPSDGSIADHPVSAIMGRLMAGGGLILHGEQAFTYHRPLTAGEELHYEGVVRDVYEKTSKDRLMTFIVVEDTFRDAAGEPVVTSTMNLIHRA